MAKNARLPIEAVKKLKRGVQFIDRTKYNRKREQGSRSLNKPR